MMNPEIIPQQKHFSATGQYQSPAAINPYVGVHRVCQPVAPHRRSAYREMSVAGIAFYRRQKFDLCRRHAVGWMVADWKSDDTHCAEAQFKTLKYHPGFILPVNTDDRDPRPWCSPSRITAEPAES